MARPLPIVKASAGLVDRIDGFAGHHRAFLKIQDGCDAHCTYCIIPRLRPRLRSKSVELAVSEARGLVRAGHREIILTGIFLGAFGRETALRRRFVKGISPLADLVRSLAEVEGLERLRLSSLEPGDVDEALLEVLATHTNCVPHLHLPLQSGSGSILRRMNRQYTREAFIDMIDRVRTALDQPAITTDIIVGFPGESDADFEASLEVARYSRFCKIHAFPFSPRPQTAAARWQREFVPPSIARERMQRLAEVERQCSLEYRRALIGRVERVIVEHGVGSEAGSAPHAGSAEVGIAASPTGSARAKARSSAEATSMREASCVLGLLGDGVEEVPPSNIHRGRSDRYFEIHFESPTARPGELVNVRIDRVTPTRTHGIVA